MKRKLKAARVLRLLCVIGFCVSVFITISYAVFNKSLESSATEKMKKINGENVFDYSERVKFWLIVSLIMLAFMILSIILLSVMETQMKVEQKMLDEKATKAGGTHSIESSLTDTPKVIKNKWNCPKCGKENSSQFNKCYNCKYDRTYAWVCPACGAQNSLHPDKCFNCCAANPDYKEREQGEQN